MFTASRPKTTDADFQSAPGQRHHRRSIMTKSPPKKEQRATRKSSQAAPPQAFSRTHRLELSSVGLAHTSGSRTKD